jgi:hypothetical protein
MATTEGGADLLDFIGPGVQHPARDQNNAPGTGLIGFLAKDLGGRSILGGRKW